MSVVESREPASGPSTHPGPRLEAETIVRALTARTSTPVAMVERVVAEELIRFRGARVTNFIPILVERAAERRLAGLSVEDASLI